MVGDPSLVDQDTLKEAFRRAMMSGRVFPTVAEFPSSVSRGVVESVYFAYLRSMQEEREGLLEPSSVRYAIPQPSTEEDGMAAVVPTWAGDGVAAMLVMEDLKLL